MMHLLKLKSKKIEGIKKRKKYEPLDILGQISKKNPAPFQMAPPAMPAAPSTPGETFNIPVPNNRSIIKPKLMKKEEQPKKE